MKGVVTALTLFLVLSLHPVPRAYSAGTLTVGVSVEPEPLHGQINSGETIFFNVSVTNDGLSVSPGQPAAEDPAALYTGYLHAVLGLEWRVSGSYDFGESTTGYTFRLDDTTLTRVIEAPVNGSAAWVRFNHTFERDAFEFGVMPYESLEVRVSAWAYFEVYNESLGVGAPWRGPLAAETSTTLKLLDETKVEYVDGKLMDMAAEVEPLRDIAGVEHVNVVRFTGYLDEMNQSVEAGNYFSALETYSKYDEKYRVQLISSLTREASASIEKTQAIEQLEHERDEMIASYEVQLGALNASYRVLEDKYVTLSHAYQTRQAELEAAKQSLSTAITAVFLASIAFFFVGRRSVGWGRDGQAKEVEGE